MADKKKIHRNVLLIAPLTGIVVTGVLVALVFFLSAQNGAANPDGMPGHHAGQVAPYAAPIVGLEESLHDGHHEGHEGHAGHEAGQGAAAGAPACDFADWAGKPVDRDALKATGRPHRVMTPGSPATMDFRADRINVLVDDDGIVLSVSCG